MMFSVRYPSLTGQRSHAATGECLQPHQHRHPPLSGHRLLQYLAGYALQLWAYATFSGNPPHSLLLCHSSLPGLLLLKSSGDSGPPGGALRLQCSQTFKARALPSQTREVSQGIRRSHRCQFIFEATTATTHPLYPITK